MFKNFLEYAGGPQGHGVTSSNFKNKIKDFCKYKGYDFNRDKPIDKPNGGKIYYSDWKPQHEDESYLGGDDKSNSKEYFTISIYSYGPIPQNTEEDPF